MFSNDNKQKYHLNEYKYLKYEVTNSRTLQQLLTFFFQHIQGFLTLLNSICFSVLLRFIAVVFDTSDMSFSFSPLSTQVTNSCSSSLIVLSACCLNASVSYISWSITSICLLFLSCSFFDLLVSE